jgi:hypothetical protein
VIAYALNQSHGYWLLSDVLNSVISIILKLKDALDVLPSLQNLMEEESIIVDELTSLAFNIKKGNLCCVKVFLFFFENNKAHKMIFLMLDPTFKSFFLISSFVGMEQRVAIVEDYARKSLYPMLLKCDHSLVEIKSSFANIGVAEDYNLDIFEHTH